MLDTSYSSLMREYQAADEFRRKRLSNLDKQLARFAGPFYGTSSDKTLWAPNNIYYQYCANIVPRLIYNNPRFAVTTLAPVRQREVATMMQHGLNRWASQGQFHKTLIQLVTDSLYRFGVSLTKSISDGSQAEDDPRWPQVYRLPPHYFYIDAMCLDEAEARWKGHEYRADKDSLLERAKKFKDQGWNKDVIKSLPTGDDLKEGMTLDSRGGSLGRNEIRLIEVWVPEGLSEGDGSDNPDPETMHGWVYTIAPDGGEDFPREPYRHFGHRAGPYDIFGMYYVPNEPLPLAPLCAIEARIQELNIQALAISTANRKYKRGAVFGGPNPDLMEAFVEQPDLFMLHQNGHENSKFSVFEYGGASQRQVEHWALLLGQLNEELGISQAQKGDLQSGVTATANAIAGESSLTRIGFMQGRTAANVEAVTNKVGFYLYYDKRVKFRLGSDAGRELGMSEPLFVGGKKPFEDYGVSMSPDLDSTYDDLAIKIDPYSLERTSETVQQRRFGTLLEVMSALIPLVAQYPEADWEWIFNLAGDVTNIPELSQVLNKGMVEKRQLMEMLLKMQPQGGGAAQTGAQGGKASGETRALNAAPPKPSGPKADAPAWQSMMAGSNQATTSVT